MSEIPKSPPRLLQDGSVEGELLRRANREFAEDIDEPRAFQRLDERLAKRSRQRRWSFAAVVAAALGAYAFFASQRPPAIELTRELLAPKAALAGSVPAFVKNAPAASARGRGHGDP